MYCLEIVLSAETHSLIKITEGINPKTGELIEAFSHSYSDIGSIWKLLAMTHLEYSNELVIIDLEDKNIKYSNIDAKVLEQANGGFNIKFLNGSIDYSVVGGVDFSLKKILIKNLVIDEDDADKWLELLIKQEILIQARLYDYEYDYWQNAHDLLQYEAVGRSTNGLELISNGLPFPLEQNVINTSNNPGRWQFRDNYIESIGSVMWFGNEYWSNSGVSKNAILDNNWLNASDNGLRLKIKVHDKPFTSSINKEGQLQQELRELLFL